MYIRKIKRFAEIYKQFQFSRTAHFQLFRHNVYQVRDTLGIPRISIDPYVPSFFP